MLPSQLEAYTYVNDYSHTVKLCLWTHKFSTWNVNTGADGYYEGTLFTHMN